VIEIEPERTALDERPHVAARGREHGVRGLYAQGMACGAGAEDNSRGWSVLVAVIAGVVVLCGGLVAWRFGSAIVASATAKNQVDVVLERFMRRMADKDLSGDQTPIRSSAQRASAASRRAAP
jgi:hypothetical protein